MDGRPGRSSSISQIALLSSNLALWWPNIWLKMGLDEKGADHAERGYMIIPICGHSLFCLVIIGDSHNLVLNGKRTTL